MSKAGNRLAVDKPRTVGGWNWTARTAPTEAEARRIFTQVERALDAMTAAPARVSVSRGRTGNAPADAYIADSRARSKAPGRSSSVRADCAGTSGLCSATYRSLTGGLHTPAKSSRMPNAEA